MRNWCIYVYLFVCDLAWQRLNAHAQTSLTVTVKGRHQKSDPWSRGSALSVAQAQGP